MKKVLILLSAILLLATGCCNKQCKKARFFTWADYSEKVDWDAYCKEMNRVGLDGLLIESGVEGLNKVIPIAEKYGIEVHCWHWIMNNGRIAAEHPEWLDYNALGESLKDSIAYIKGYKFLNPAIKEVREAIKSEFEELLKVEKLKGISLDYCRFVDVILPINLWKRYNIVQDSIYPKWDYGYHPEMIRQYKEQTGKEPKADDPEWLDFRCNQINTLVEELVELAHKYGKKISASPFPTPKMSKEMVRQDWGAWHLDMAFPMIYHGFYRGDIDWAVNCIKECKQDAWNNMDIYYGLIVGDFRKGNEKIEDYLLAAKEAGAKGFSFFQFGGLNDDQKEAVKQVIENWDK